jgi:hypothetical protein
MAGRFFACGEASAEAGGDPAHAVSSAARRGPFRRGATLSGDQISITEGSKSITLNCLPLS